jgi:valyl-tRNA synthetase
MAVHRRRLLSHLRMQLEKTYESAAVEAKWCPIWQQRGWFRPEAAADPSRKPFVMVIRPPNMTGWLHIGHALNNTPLKRRI